MESQLRPKVDQNKTFKVMSAKNVFFSPVKACLFTYDGLLLYLDCKSKNAW